MLAGHQDELTFGTALEYQSWLESQNWYQTIDLSNGLRTHGRMRTDLRVEQLSKLEFSGKSVLDVGCNSGQYSLLAKKLGARAVAGVDIDPVRIQQAKVLAANEGLDVEFQVGGIESVAELGRFDLVICIAVLTEIENVIGGLRLLRDCIREKAVLEMGLSRPIAYLSRNRRWWKRDAAVSRRGAVGEFHRHRHAGWVIYPSLELIRDVFGSAFQVTHAGPGLRYDIVHIERR